MTAKQFEPENYREYLRMLARASVNSHGPIRSTVDASVIVQDTLLQAWKSLPEFRGETDAAFALWLRTILNRKLIDAFRYLHRDKRDAGLEQSFRVILDSSASGVFFNEPADKKPAPIDELVREERARRVAAVLETLPDDERTAVELHYLSEHSIQQIAGKMGQPSEYVTLLVRRGIKALRESLKDA